MRPFLKSTRFILSLSILAHAGGVIALLYSIGILTFDKKIETKVDAPQVTQEVPAVTEVATAPALAPEPQAVPEAPKPARKIAKPKKAKPIKLESSDESAADAAAEAEIASEDKANEVQIVQPAPIERLQNKALLKEEDAPVKLTPVKERPDGVQAQESNDSETEAKSKDAKDAQEAVDSATSDPTVSETGGRSNSAI